MVSVRRSKTNPDFYVVTGGPGGTVSVMGKSKADEIAAARRRVIKKRRAAANK